MIVGSKIYYNSHINLPLTTSFQEFNFNFSSTYIILVNDSAANWIEFSFDGVTVHGRLSKEEVLHLTLFSKPYIYLRGQRGNEPYRIWVW